MLNLPGVKNKQMKNKRIVLFGLVILLTGVIYFAVQALQKNETHRPDFSGEWKAKESMSMGGNIVCIYDEGDRMLSKTMKITEQPDYLTIETPNPSASAKQAVSQEKLAFDGTESKIDHEHERGKKFTVNLSADRKTMTVNSTVHLMVASPYRVHVQEQMIVYVTEVWKLSNDGKSITVQAKAKTDLFSEDERSWKTVFNKIN